MSGNIRKNLILLLLVGTVIAASFQHEREDDVYPEDDSDDDSDLQLQGESAPPLRQDDDSMARADERKIPWKLVIKGVKL